MSTRTYPLFADHPSKFPTDGSYRAICSHVVDGDTADVLVDLPFGVATYETLRFHAFDTPELHASDPTERQRAQEAKQFCIERIENKPVLLRTYKDDQTFGRYVADVWFWKDEVWHDLVAALREAKLEKRV